MASKGRRAGLRHGRREGNLPRSGAARSGFTLIELLVVTGILGVLTALLLPLLSGAREKAHRISCVSHLRQVGLGMVAYASDAGEYYPLCIWKNPHIRANGYLGNVTTHNVHASFNNLLWDRYVPSAGVFFCPSTRYYWRDRSRRETLQRYSERDNPSYFNGYFYWGWAALRMQDASVYPYHLTTRNMDRHGRPEPDRFALLGDVTLGWPGNSWSTGAGYPGGPPDVMFTAHRAGSPEGMNVLFGDNHVAWLGVARLEYSPGGNGQLWPNEAEYLLQGRYWDPYEATPPFPF